MKKMKVYHPHTVNGHSIINYKIMNNEHGEEEKKITGKWRKKGYPEKKTVKTKINQGNNDDLVCFVHVNL